MSTLFERFPGLIRTLQAAESGVTPLPVLAEYAAGPTLGKYVFSNYRVGAFTVQGNDVVILDSIKIGSNIDELSFSLNLESPFRLQAYRAGNGTPVSMSPWTFSNYQQGENFSAIWRPTNLSGNSSETILFGIDGTVKQGPELVTLPVLKIWVSACVYLVKQQTIEEWSQNNVAI